MSFSQSHRTRLALLALALGCPGTALAQGSPVAVLPEPPLLQAPADPEDPDDPRFEVTSDAARPVPSAPGTDPRMTEPPPPHGAGPWPQEIDRAPADHGDGDGASAGAARDSAWRLGFGGPPAAAVRLLDEVGLPAPASERLRALERELRSLPAQVSPSGATSFGQIFTEASLTIMAVGGLAALESHTQSELEVGLLITGVGLAMLPIGVVTWIIGEAVDGHRRRALDRRRRSLVAEIRRETTFDPRW